MFGLPNPQGGSFVGGTQLPTVYYFVSADHAAQMLTNITGSGLLAPIPFTSCAEAIYKGLGGTPPASAYTDNDTTTVSGTILGLRALGYPAIPALRVMDDYELSDTDTHTGCTRTATLSADGLTLTATAPSADWVGANPGDIVTLNKSGLYTEHAHIASIAGADITLTQTAQWSVPTAAYQSQTGITADVAYTANFPAWTSTAVEGYKSAWLRAKDHLKEFVALVGNPGVVALDLEPYWTTNRYPTVGFVTALTTAIETVDPSDGYSFASYLRATFGTVLILPGSDDSYRYLAPITAHIPVLEATEAYYTVARKGSNGWQSTFQTTRASAEARGNQAWLGLYIPCLKSGSEHLLREARRAGAGGVWTYWDSTCSSSSDTRFSYYFVGDSDWYTN